MATSSRGMWSGSRVGRRKLQQPSVTLSQRPEEEPEVVSSDTRMWPSHVQQRERLPRESQG